MENLSTAFSILLFVIAIHFLLKGINYKKIIYLCKNSVIKKENFENKKSKVNKENKKNKKKESNDENKEEHFENKIECIPGKIVGSNAFANNENDSNFQSNVLNTTKFYQQNKPNDSNNVISNTENRNITESPHRWNYKNEFVMNGGELMNGVTGMNDDIDNYYNINNSSSNNFSNCFPFTKSSILDDDIRLGK